MKAAIYKKYGPPDVLQIREVENPVPGDSEILVKVHVSTVNRTDCATIRAKPWFMRLLTGLTGPKKQIPGTEFAGVIESAGKNVSSFQPGDRVFGFDDYGSGAHAQFMTVKEERAILIPDRITFRQAAPSLEGAHYAYNFINKVDLKKGQKVIVNGATGAIGSAAVQLLKLYDVSITAVCGTENIDLIKSLGAERVIDYKKEDFTKDDRQYDLVIDAVGKSSYFRCKRILKKGGIYISSDLGFMSQNIILPIITPILKPLLGNQKTIFPTPADLPGSTRLIKRLMEEGKFNAVIDREYPFSQIIDAYRYVDAGQKTGNVIVTF